MKILYLTHALPRFRGDRVTTFIGSLALAFRKAGHDLRVLAPSHPALDHAYQRSLYPFRAYRYLPLKRWEVLGYGAGMSDGLRQNRLNYTRGPLMIAAGCVSCYREARRFAPDLIFANWGLPNGFIGAVTARLLGTRLITTFPGADVKIIQSSFVYRLFARFTASVATVLTTNSADLRAGLIEAGLPGRKIHFVIYGADPGELRPERSKADVLRKSQRIEPAEVVVGSLGRFVPKKGFACFLDAIPHVLAALPASAPPVRFVLFGEGEEEASLRQRARELGIGKTLLFPGPIVPERLSEAYNLIDVFVNPATRRPIDGLNVVVPEAMACGCPIVGTNVCGNELVVREGENGYLVPEEEPAALAHAVSRLIIDKAMRRRMGEESRRLVERHFSWEHIVERYVGLVEAAS